MFQALLALSEAEAPADSFASVRLAVSGAAELPRDVADRFRERFGVTIYEGYGLTEAAPIVSTTAVDRAPRHGSIGPPLPGVEVRLVDADGTDVTVGDPGEIWVRGNNVFAGYWDDPEATERVLRDGWLRTGDVAVSDDDGYLSLVDRLKDLIIVSGFNVYPAEVEDIVATHPDVAEVAVIGVPSARTGEAVAAFVVPRPGGAAPNLASTARPRVPPPRAVQGAHRAARRRRAAAQPGGQGAAARAGRAGRSGLSGLAGARPAPGAVTRSRGLRPGSRRRSR